MKTPLFLALAVLLFASCGEKSGAPETDALSAASRNRRPGTREILERCMPGVMADGMVKVAVVRTLTISDHARQFLDGCAAEGRALGFTVDIFTTASDDSCRELLARITRAGYDGIILSQGSADVTWNALKPAVEKGIKVVTFDALPFKNGDLSGEILPGVTATFQDDAALARISLEVIVSRFGEKRPARVIRAWYGPGNPPQDRRLRVYDRMIQNGVITEAALVSPPDFAYSRSGVRDALAAILPNFPPGSVDVIWASYEEFAKGCADALSEAGRSDIKLVSIDISNDDIRLMLDHADLWLGTAAVDPRRIGTVNMRLLAAKFAGEETPAIFYFKPYFVETARLDRRANMMNLGRILPGWDEDGELFNDYPWMEELKAVGEYDL
jgi:simple sugar transport system substrate-binding protein